MSTPLRSALAVVIAAGFGMLSTRLIAPPWGFVYAFVGGFAIGYLLVRAK